MPKSYIKVEELINLIKQNEKDGFINDQLLQSYIKRLKINSLPAKYSTKERDGVYNISDHLQAINKYQQAVKVGIRKSYIQLHMENHFGIAINKKDLKIYSTGKEMRITEKGKDSLISIYGDSEEFENLDIVTTEQELMEIFNISKGTVNTWKKKGIIKQYRIRIHVEIDGIDYKYRGYWLKHYDLECIREELRHIKH